MITVIEQTTAERDEETRQLFEAIRPFLDKGLIYSKAVSKVTGRKGHMTYSNRWFRDLVDYGESQGYPYKKYSGKGKVR